MKGCGAAWMHGRGGGGDEFWFCTCACTHTATGDDDDSNSSMLSQDLYVCEAADGKHALGKWDTLRWKLCRAEQLSAAAWLALHVARQPS